LRANQWTFRIRVPIRPSTPQHDAPLFVAVPTRRWGTSNYAPSSR